MASEEAIRAASKPGLEARIVLWLYRPASSEEVQSAQRKISGLSSRDPDDFLEAVEEKLIGQSAPYFRGIWRDVKRNAFLWPAFFLGPVWYGWMGILRLGFIRTIVRSLGLACACAVLFAVTKDRTLLGVFFLVSAIHFTVSFGLQAAYDYHSYVIRETLRIVQDFETPDDMLTVAVVRGRRSLAGAVGGLLAAAAGTLIFLVIVGAAVANFGPASDRALPTIPIIRL
jgi:hypothetical protein